MPSILFPWLLTENSVHFQAIFRAWVFSPCANHSLSLPKALVALVSGPKEAVSGRRVTLCHIRPHSVDPRHWKNGNSQDCEVAFLGVLLSPIIVLSDLIHLQL